MAIFRRMCELNWEFFMNKFNLCLTFLGLGVIKSSFDREVLTGLERSGI